MRLILTIALSLVVFAYSPAPACAQEKPLETQILTDDVRGFVWGLPASVIRENEKAEHFGDFENTITFYGEHLGVRAYITYVFYQDRLGRVIVAYDHNKPDPQGYLDDYVRVSEGITAFHGAPVSEDVRASNSRFKNDPERWGLGMIQGHLQFSKRWDSPRTLIQLDLKGEDFKSKMEATYFSKSVFDTAQSAPTTGNNQ